MRVGVGAADARDVEAPDERCGVDANESDESADDANDDVDTRPRRSTVEPIEKGCARTCDRMRVNEDDDGRESPVEGRDMVVDGREAKEGRVLLERDGAKGRGMVFVAL